MTQPENQAEALKPCPFCGGTFVAQGASRDYISVWCNCGARGPEVKFPEDCDPLPPIRECYKAWNRRAALPEAPAVPVGVKALEWQAKPGGRGEFADSPCGRYEVGVIHGAYLAVVRIVRDGQWDDDVIANGLCAKDEAKAAAQADFEARIRSALQSSPPVKAAAVDGAAIRGPVGATGVVGPTGLTGPTADDLRNVFVAIRGMADAALSLAAKRGQTR